MSDATLLNMIAANHAMGHANAKEAWLCQCIACKFTKEYKIVYQEDDGSTAEATVADALIETLQEQGYNSYL